MTFMAEVKVRGVKVVGLETSREVVEECSLCVCVCVGVKTLRL